MHTPTERDPQSPADGDPAATAAALAHDDTADLEQGELLPPDPAEEDAFQEEDAEG